MRASEFIKQELDEKVNPRVVEPGFTAEKRLGNRYVMKAEARYTGEPGDDLRGLIIKVYDTKARPTMLNWGIGMTRFVARQDPTTQDWYLVSSTTHVDDRYQRQGLASAMYNWARELGNDIEPSSNRTKMGKHFWEKGAGAGREFVDQPPETAAPPAIPTSTAAGPAKAQSLRDRLVKMFTEEPAVTEGLTEYKNTPLQDYNGLQFMIDSNHPYLRVEAFAPGSGQQLAQVDFKIDDQDELHPEDLHVEERWRGQGIAQIMYDFVKSKGYTIHRSWSQTDAGSEFWNKHRGQKRVWEQGDSEVKSHDFMAGHCHVMALALKQLHPDWQIRAHVGYDDDAADDTEYRVDHVYTVAPDGTAYDCRGRFSNEQQLVGPDTTGGVDTQYVNFGPEEIKQAMLRGELKRFTKQDLANAMQTATQAGKKNIAEAPDGYKEIEFVCVNPRFPDATDPALQKKMYRGLKQIDGVVPLWQEWGDYSEGQASLSAIYQDSASRDKILSLAKQLGVEVDLEQAVSDDYVGRAMRGEHEGQQGVAENFADGRNPQDKGDAKRHGINTKASVSSLRKTAKQGGRKGQLAHWLANMKSGRAKKKKTNETVIGTLHFPKLIIAVDDHAIDRTRTRGISPATIDQSLRKLNGIADQLGQMESSNTVWVYDVSNNIALGLRRTSSRDMRFTLKTVVADRPFDGTTPIIELTS